MCCQDKQDDRRSSEELTAAGDAAEQAHPCTGPSGCEHPERLKAVPGTCSPEQIRRCHGDQ